MRFPINNPERLAFMRRESVRVAGWSPELAAYLRKHQIDDKVAHAHAGGLNIALVKFMADDSGHLRFDFDIDGEAAAVIDAILFDGIREPAVVGSTPG